MRPNLLLIPAELKLNIAELLAPFPGTPSYFPTDCRTMVDDIEAAFFEITSLLYLALTCKEMYAICSRVLRRTFRIAFNNRHMHFVKGMDDGSLVAPFADTQSTWFLRLEYSSYRHFPKPRRSTVSVSTKPEHHVDGLSTFERSIDRIFQLFSGVTVLDIDGWQLSVANLCALASLKSLHTLSIREPEYSCGPVSSVREFPRVCSMPKVSNLLIKVRELEGCTSICNAVELFKRSITMLSIVGMNYGGDDGEDFLDSLLMSDGHEIGFEELKHLSVDFLQFQAKSHRMLVSSCKKIESIAIDCRGMIGFLPLYYVIDLIRIISGEVFDIAHLLKYDAVQADWAVGFEEEPPYPESTRVWTTRISRFFCSFAPHESTSGPIKTPERLELIVAAGDEDCEPINVGLQVKEFLEVFSTHAQLFKVLKKLTFGTSTESYFLSTETDEQLKDAVSIMHRDCLPSVTDVAFEWGQVKKFCWFPGRGDVNSRMDIDTI